MQETRTISGSICGEEDADISIQWPLSELAKVRNTIFGRWRDRREKCYEMESGNPWKVSEIGDWVKTWISCIQALGFLPCLYSSPIISISWQISSNERVFTVLSANARVFFQSHDLQFPLCNLDIFWFLTFSNCGAKSLTWNVPFTDEQQQNGM